MAFGSLLFFAFRFCEGFLPVSVRLEVAATFRDRTREALVLSRHRDDGPDSGRYGCPATGRYRAASVN